MCSLSYLVFKSTSDLRRGSRYKTSCLTCASLPCSIPLQEQGIMSVAFSSQQQTLPLPDQGASDSTRNTRQESKSSSGLTGQMKYGCYYCAGRWQDPCTRPSTWPWQAERAQACAWLTGHAEAWATSAAGNHHDYQMMIHPAPSLNFGVSCVCHISILKPHQRHNERAFTYFGMHGCIILGFPAVAACGRLLPRPVCLRRIRCITREGRLHSKMH